MKLSISIEKEISILKEIEHLEKFNQRIVRKIQKLQDRLKVGRR